MPGVVPASTGTRKGTIHSPYRLGPGVPPWLTLPDEANTTSIRPATIASRTKRLVLKPPGRMAFQSSSAAATSNAGSCQRMPMNGSTSGVRIAARPGSPRATDALERRQASEVSQVVRRMHGREAERRDRGNQDPSPLLPAGAADVPRHCGDEQQSEDGILCGEGPEQEQCRLGPRFLERERAGEQRDDERLGVRLVDPPHDGAHHDGERRARVHAAQEHVGGQSEQRHVDERERPVRLQARRTDHTVERDDQDGVEPEVHEVLAPIAAREAVAGRVRHLTTGEALPGRGDG